jgi:hypothetical protein
MSSDGFLSRWSRRKEEARRAEAAPEPPPEEALPPAEDTAPAAAPELTPEEIALLPKVEELTAESDFSGFLRRGVPESLRNAALRKMWVLDPAIRDFEGHARDYAYDWNVPGGVPGTGPLGPGDDVAAMARRVFGEAEPEAGTDQSRVEASRNREPPASPDGDQPIAAAPQQGIEGDVPGSVQTGAESASGPPPDGEPRTSSAAPQSKSPEKSPPALASRRHGSAKPA